MSGQELMTTEPAHTPMFTRPTPMMMGGVNAGAVSIEVERAIAEAQGQILVAKRFPRDLNAAFAEVMEACKMPAMAAVAFWSKPQGGSTISGPSIRLAEELARVVGNIEYGHRELSRSDNKSEVEVYAWDKEGNTRRTRQITVMHVIDTRSGGKPCRDQSEIDGLIANKASKQMRGQILSLIPAWLKEAAMEECRKTLAGGNGIPLAERVRRMTQAFAPHGVTVTHLEAHLGHKLDMTTADELVDLLGFFNAIKDGAKPSEIFAIGGEEDEPSEQANKIAAQAASKPAETKKRPAPAAAEKPAEKTVEPAEKQATETKAETGQPAETQQPAALVEPQATAAIAKEPAAEAKPAEAPAAAPAQEIPVTTAAQSAAPEESVF